MKRSGGRLHGLEDMWRLFHEFQGVLYTNPVEIATGFRKIIKIDDAVCSFSEVMEHIDLQKYFIEKKGDETGRPRYDFEKLLKIVLFGGVVVAAVLL